MNLRTCYQGVILNQECDSNDHMNVMYYVRKFEHSGRVFCGIIGLTPSLLNSNDWGLVVVHHDISYHHELLVDDLIKIDTGLLEMGNKSFTLQHEMHLLENDTLICKAKIKLLVLDKTSRKSIPLPEFVQQNLVGKQ